MHNILVVDDEPLNIKLIIAFLEDHPYNVTAVTNSTAALDILRTNAEFDLILLDRMLPEIDGLELTAIIKNDPRLRAIPIVMQTAAEKAQIAKGINAGITNYITKPYNEEDLLALIVSCLDIR